MAGILNKAQKFLLGFGNEEDDYEEYIEEYEEEDDEDDYEEVKPEKKAKVQRSSSIKEQKSVPSYSDRVARIHPEAQTEIVLAHPETVDDAPVIVNNVRSNHVCIVNLQGIEKERAQRIADFLGGAAYSLGGNIERISNEIFIIAPCGVSISGKLKGEIKSGSSIFPWLSSVTR